MIARIVFRPDVIDLPDGRVLRKRRCRQHRYGGDCHGDGWIGDDEMTLQVSTDQDDVLGIGMLHLSLSYAGKRVPTAAEVRMIRARVAEMGAGELVAEPIAFVRRHVVQVVEISPTMAAFYGMGGIPIGALQFDLNDGQDGDDHV